MTSSPDTLTIRTARADDAPAILRLAVLDSQRPLTGAALLAEVDGVAVAAIGIADGRVLADPFRRTVDVAGVLSARAVQLRDTDRSSPRRLPRRLALARTG